MSPVNFKWQQGEDLIIELAYKEGATAKSAVAINLTENYSARMDLVVPNSSEVVYSYTSGPDTFGPGLVGQPNIRIVLPRALTLPSGAVYQRMGPQRTATLAYDLFLRNTTSNLQVKVLFGSIFVEGS